MGAGVNRRAAKYSVGTGNGQPAESEDGRVGGAFARCLGHRGACGKSTIGTGAGSCSLLTVHTPWDGLKAPTSN